jgi:hypothetical protein
MELRGVNVIVHSSRCISPWICFFVKNYKRRNKTDMLYGKNPKQMSCANCYVTYVEICRKEKQLCIVHINVLLLLYVCLQ